MPENELRLMVQRELQIQTGKWAGDLANFTDEEIGRAYRRAIMEIESQ
jgi:hypothetical protein